MLSKATAGWARYKLGEIYRNRKEGGRSRLPVMSVTMNDGLVSRESLDRRVASALNPRDHLLVKKGDLVYNTMRMWQGVSGVAAEDCLVSPAYVVCQPTDCIDPAFGGYLMKSDPLVRTLRGHSQGLTSDRLRLYFHHFANIRVTVPPLPEQKKIVGILSSVDDAIQAKRAVIEQTRRVKEGLLQDLLTKGIGHTRFKQTEIGEVPETWETRPVTALGEVTLGRQKAPKYMTGNCAYPYLRVVNIFDDRLDLSDVAEMDFEEEALAKYRLRYGDILITEGDLGSAWNVGRTAVFRDEIDDCCFQNTLIRFRPGDPAEAAFFHIAFGSLRIQGFFARKAAATTVFHLSAGRFKTILVPFPPPKERDEITQIVSAVDQAIDAGKAKLVALQETRVGLLQDLLTGKVRVTV